MPTVQEELTPTCCSVKPVRSPRVLRTPSSGKWFTAAAEQETPDQRLALASSPVGPEAEAGMLTYTLIGSFERLLLKGSLNGARLDGASLVARLFRLRA